MIISCDGWRCHMWKISQLSSCGLSGLFVYQSIDQPLFSLCDYPSCSSFSPSPCRLRSKKKKTEHGWNINQMKEKGQWYNGPAGMMPLSFTYEIIVPEPVNCHPGSAEGSHILGHGFILWRDRGLIMLIYETILDKYMTLELKRQKKMYKQEGH